MTDTSSIEQATGSSSAEGLTIQQYNYFTTFGFLHLPGFFGSQETTEIIDAFEQVFAEEEATEQFAEVHFGQRSLGIPYLLDLHPRLGRLKSDPRILGIVESLIDGEYEYRQSAGNLYYCDTSWHCDIYDSPLEQFHVKFLWYLDPLDGSSGGLRVIPGTNEHGSRFASGLRTDLQPVSSVEERFGVPPEQIPGWPIITQPGDLIISSFRTIHATFGGAPRRRLMTMNYRAVANPS